jgi:hypothetical protein
MQTGNLLIRGLAITATRRRKVAEDAERTPHVLQT